MGIDLGHLMLMPDIERSFGFVKLFEAVLRV